LPPLSILRDVTTPGGQADEKHHLKEMVPHICLDPGEEALKAINYEGKD
jgi:hypothetical protein